MAYKAIVDFKDLRTDHEYKSGDVYPFTGKADKERVEQLITPTAQRGALIAEVADDTVEKKRSNKKTEKKED